MDLPLQEKSSWCSLTTTAAARGSYRARVFGLVVGKVVKRTRSPMPNCQVL